ncbi:branched-subunit amino acid transport protein AzlD [Arthrobacter sp. 1088]|uniref:branched-chain amino acid transporter permease n=1 Tax=Arthrobacter sp. 1088 TaxID=2817768 RepID=UPI002864DE81|nr:AzlD domain-containing protein [Arthrobacter sp. 1088]MDR6688681.1 branched-subunit amino acid transport protein AzlD [Arthrobacter sp. 1088]
MPEVSYILAVLAIVFTITFALRALPFAALTSLRESGLVKVLSRWMPVGILGILAASTLRTTIIADPTHSLVALAAVCTTAVTHLLCGRRTLVSVGVGTCCYVLLVNLF